MLVHFECISDFWPNLNCPLEEQTKAAFIVLFFIVLFFIILFFYFALIAFQFLNQLNVCLFQDKNDRKLNMTKKWIKRSHNKPEKEPT